MKTINRSFWITELDLFEVIEEGVETKRMHYIRSILFPEKLGVKKQAEMEMVHRRANPERQLFFEWTTKLTKRQMPLEQFYRQSTERNENEGE